MKSITYIITTVLLILTGLISCKKEKLPENSIQISNKETPDDSLDTPDNCGCGDNYSVTEKSGTIYYKITPHHADTSVHHKFWITSKEGSIYVYRIVCNKVLPSSILKLEEDDDTLTKLNVIYSGDLKNTCKEMHSGYNNGSQVYYNIFLTKIEVQ